jgi:putative cell wall-binding protein
VATGLDFPDALAAGPILGAKGIPLLLVNPTGPLPTSVASYLSGIAPDAAAGIVVGGTAAVSDEVAAETQAALSS